MSDSIVHALAFAYVLVMIAAGMAIAAALFLLVTVPLWSFGLLTLWVIGWV